MFIRDTPIKTSDKDLLEREDYAKHLGDSILDWKEEESIVIALNGKWGEGKTSIMNMALEHINRNSEKKNTQNDNKEHWLNIFKKKNTSLNPSPTIIKYNPWAYSELNDLTTSFFGEISRELKIKNTSKKDKKIAKKLKEYAQFLRFLPTHKDIVTGTSILISSLGLLGISLKELGNWLNLSSFANSEVWTVFSYLLLSIAALIVIFNKVADFFSLRSKFSEKTALEIKKELHRELSKRKKQLLIIIDDIDRLTADEIKEIFRLIKQNADFPNTIYLLPFDRNVIIENLNTSLGVSGEVYLEKIIQVQFNIPKVSEHDIDTYLSSSLKNINYRMPNNNGYLFSLDSKYGTIIYSKGLVKLFKNLREVKRYISSLEFNISQLYKDGVLEVNPIDFYAVEALRIFEPNFFDFIKQNKELLTDQYNESIQNQNINLIKNEILQKGFNLISNDRKESVMTIFGYLFPQLHSLVHKNRELPLNSPVFDNLNPGLRICSPIHFNSYFSYLPKGSRMEVSEYEMKLIYNSTSDTEAFEMTLNRFEKNKIKKILNMFRVNLYETHLIIANLEYMIVPLLNLTDKLNDKVNPEFNRTYDTVILIKGLLTRIDSLEVKYNLLADATRSSNSLLGITMLIGDLIGEENQNDDSTVQLLDLIDEHHIKLLKKSCFERINSSVQDRSLFKMNDALYILSLWRSWVLDFRDGNYLKDTIHEIVEDDKHLLEFLSIFKSKSNYYTEFNFDKFSAYDNNFKFIINRLKNINLSSEEYSEKEYQELVDILSKFYSPIA